MKRILLLVFCLYTASCTVSYAQDASAQVTPRPRPTVSKADYTAKVAQLYKLAGQNKNDEAKATFQDIQKMMHSALGVTKFKIKDAMDAHNDAQKTHYYETMGNQNKIYNEVITLREDLVANKDSMNKKLNEFGATIE